MQQPGAEPAATVAEIQDLLREAIPEELNLRLLKGFKMDLSANPDFHKVFVSAHCDCGTAALLSLEVDRSKTRTQVQEALPTLVRHLKNKAQQFAGMSCQMHARMRQGGMGTGVAADSADSLEA